MYVMARNTLRASAHSKVGGVVGNSFLRPLMERGMPLTSGACGPLASTVNRRSLLLGFAAKPVASISVWLESMEGITVTQPFCCSLAVLSDATFWFFQNVMFGEAI